jgi:hypothetical protein
MALHSLDSFCNWLGATPPSQTIQTLTWVIPAVQTVHILTVAAVVTSALMIDLRLLAVNARDQSLAGIARRFLPFVWWSLPILLLTGAILIIAEPARSLENPIFALKMLLVLAAAAVTLACQIPLQGNPGYWEESPARKRTARLIAAISTLLWAAIICAGRWIAYVQGT